MVVYQVEFLDVLIESRVVRSRWRGATLPYLLRAPGCGRPRHPFLVDVVHVRTESGLISICLTYHSSSTSWPGTSTYMTMSACSAAVTGLHSGCFSATDDAGACHGASGMQGASRSNRLHLRSHRPTMYAIRFPSGYALAHLGDK